MNHSLQSFTHQPSCGRFKVFFAFPISYKEFFAFQWRSTKSERDAGSLFRYGIACFWRALAARHCNVVNRVTLTSSWIGWPRSTSEKDLPSRFTESRWTPSSRSVCTRADFAGFADADAATCRAVLRSLSRASGSAPHSIKSRMTSSDGKTQIGYRPTEELSREQAR